MTRYTVYFTRTAEHQFALISPRERAYITRRIDALEENPLPRGSNKLNGAESLYRIRWGEFRILYEIRNKLLIVVVIRIVKRDEVYRRIKESGHVNK